MAHAREMYVENLQECLWDSAGGKPLISEKDLDDIWQGYTDLGMDSKAIHKVIHDPKGVHKVIHDPKGVHKVIHDPKGVHKVIHDPKGVHKVIHDPKGIHKVIHDPKAKHKVSHDSKVKHKASHDSKVKHQVSHKRAYHEHHKRPETELPSRFYMDTCVDAIQMVAYRSNEFLTMENMNRSIQKLFKMIKNPKVDTPRKLENLKKRIYAFSRETVWMSNEQIQEIRDGKYDGVCVSEVLTLKAVAQEIVGDRENVMEVSVLEPTFSVENGKVDINLKEEDINLIGGLQ